MMATAPAPAYSGSIARRRHATARAWSLYLEACRDARRRGAYDAVEAHAWARLEAELDRVGSRPKAAA